MKFNKHTILLILIIALGLCLRLIDVEKKLWIDEGETVIKATQISQGEMPNAYFKDKILYESTCYLPIDDPMYKCASHNFIGSKYENNKGWLTYYYLAPFIKIFGFSEYTARLPFLIFYLLTTIFIYLFVNLLFKNKNLALLASFVFTIDYFSIYHGQQSRYYSLLMMLAILSLYFNYLFLHHKKNKYLFALSSTLILIFHTHIIVAFFTLIFFFYYDFIKQKIKINKYIILNALYYLLTTIPWLILVKFWTNFQNYNSVNTYDGLKIVWTLIIGLLIVILGVLIKIIFKNQIDKNNKINYLSTFIISYLIIVPILIPAESFVSRIYSPLIPILAILMSYYIDQSIKNYKNKAVNILILTLILSTYIAIFNFTEIWGYGKGEFIENIKKYTREENFNREDIIVITHNWALSLDLYVPQKVYSYESLRNDFYNDYPNKILFVFTPPIALHDNFLLSDKYIFEQQKADQIKRLDNCKKISLHDDVVAFDCPAL